MFVLFVVVTMAACVSYIAPVAVHALSTVVVVNAVVEVVARSVVIVVVVVVVVIDTAPIIPVL